VNYESALDLILDNELDADISDSEYNSVENSAQLLYGLIHARYYFSFF
jgi:hypothetical protein